jgi:sirohydrochlorin ferrochelatase
MVHGSPRPSANQQMYQVVELIKERGVFDMVEVGFMECNDPSIPVAIETCASEGAEKIIAVPYFLHTGKHVADDLPTLLDAAAEQYPRIEFAMGRYIGESPRLTDILEKRVGTV